MFLEDRYKLSKMLDRMVDRTLNVHQKLLKDEYQSIDSFMEEFHNVF